MAVTLNSSQVQQNFGAALDQALRGDDVIVARYGAPRAALVGYERYRALLSAARALEEPPGATSEPLQLHEATTPYLVARDRTSAQGSLAQRQPSTSGETHHVVATPGVCGGRPVIRGTRIPVKAIVGYHKLGLGVDEILDGLPHLTPAQVYAALSYYYDHQEEIEQEILADQQEQLLTRYGLQAAADGRVTAAG